MSAVLRRGGAGVSHGAARERLLAIVCDVARDVPGEVLGRVADALEAFPDGAWRANAIGARDTLLAAVVPERARAAVASLLDRWEAEARGIAPAHLAWAIRAASAADRSSRERQQLELVWTGPAPGDTTFRRTDQALLELVERAQRSLLIVTFAAYDVPAIRAALLATLARGVRMSLVLESVAESGGRIAFDAALGLGDDIASESREHFRVLRQLPDRGTRRWLGGGRRGGEPGSELRGARGAPGT